MLTDPKYFITVYVLSIFFFQSPMVSENIGEPSCRVFFDFIQFNVLKINLQPAILVIIDMTWDKKKKVRCVSNLLDFLLLMCSHLLLLLVLFYV